MKGLYDVLKTVLWCNVGVFLGSSVYQYYDYATHKSLYAAQSVSWYTRVLIRGGVMAAITIVLLAVMWVIRQKAGVGAPEEENPEE